MIRFQNDKPLPKEVPHPNMRSVRETLRSQRQEAESVSEKQILLVHLLWDRTAEHDGTNCEPDHSRGQKPMPYLDRTPDSQWIRHGHDCEARGSTASADVGDISGADSRESSDRPFVRSEGLLQCRASSALHGARKYPCSDFKQHGRSQRSENLLPEMSGSVLYRSQGSSLLLPVSNGAGASVPAGPQRQAP
jgi:hypothetical protein